MSFFLDLFLCFMKLLLGFLDLFRELALVARMRQSWSPTLTVFIAGVVLMICGTPVGLILDLICG